ncbi:hypothetical protein VPH35_081456 [Triticum aestivum]
MQRPSGSWMRLRSGRCLARGDERTAPVRDPGRAPPPIPPPPISFSSSSRPPPGQVASSLNPWRNWRNLAVVSSDEIRIPLRGCASCIYKESQPRKRFSFLLFSIGNQKRKKFGDTSRRTTYSFPSIALLPYHIPRS